MRLGFDQINIQAPLPYRRLVNALIIIVVPATATFISQIPIEVMSSQTKILAGLGITYVLALLKAAEYVLGSESPESGK